MFDLRFDKPAYSQDVAHDSCVHVLEQEKKFAKWLEAEDHVVVANALLILISRTVNMLTHQIQAQAGRSTCSRTRSRRRATGSNRRAGSARS